MSRRGFYSGPPPYETINGGFTVPSEYFNRCNQASYESQSAERSRHAQLRRDYQYIQGRNEGLRLLVDQKGSMIKKCHMTIWALMVEPILAERFGSDVADMILSYCVTPLLGLDFRDMKAALEFGGAPFQ